MFSPTSGLPGILWLRNTSNNRITNQLLRKTCHSHSANAILRRNWGLWAPIPQVMALFMGKLIVHGIRRWNIRLTLRGLKPYQPDRCFFSSRGLKTWGKKTMDSPCSRHVLHWPSHGTRSSASSKPEAASSAIALAVSCAGRIDMTGSQEFRLGQATNEGTMNCH